MCQAHLVGTQHRTLGTVAHHPAATHSQRTLRRHRADHRCAHSRGLSLRSERRTITAQSGGPLPRGPSLRSEPRTVAALRAEDHYRSELCVTLSITAQSGGPSPRGPSLRSEPSLRLELRRHRADHRCAQSRGAHAQTIRSLTTRGLACHACVLSRLTTRTRGAEGARPHEAQRPTGLLTTPSPPPHPRV